MSWLPVFFNFLFGIVDLIAQGVVWLIILLAIFWALDAALNWFTPIKLIKDDPNPKEHLDE